MENRNLRLLLAAIGATLGVAIIVTLVLMSTLWPEAGKDSGKKTLPGGTANSKAGDNRGIATASNPATGQVTTPGNTTAPTLAKKTEPNGLLVTPPIREEITKGYARDPKTGEMKEIPVTIQIMMVRDPDGKPSIVPPGGQTNIVSGESVQENTSVKKIDATNSGVKKADK